MVVRQNKILTRSHADGEIVVPFIELEGRKSGPTLSIVAGVHGSEYPGIDAAIRFANEVEQSDLNGRMRIIPVMNRPALYEREEWVVPVDRKNPGRFFPGDPDGSYTESLDDLVAQAVLPGADALLEIHGGDIFEDLVPYTQSPDRDHYPDARELSLVYDLPFVVTPTAMPGANDRYTSLWQHANRSGIPACLQESGGMGTIIEEDVLRHVKGMRNTAQYLGMLPGEPLREVEQQELRTAFWKPENEGLFYPLVQIHEHITEGQVIGLIKDEFGAVIEEQKAEADAWVICVVRAFGVHTNGMITFQVAY